MDVLVAIPVFNESRYVRGVLDKVRQFHRDILFIDDGSTDGTAEFLASDPDVKLIRHSNNKGYGKSVIDSFEFAAQHGFEWVITMDCDEQHEPHRIPQFIELIATNKWDVISGSRYLEQRSDDDLPPTDRRAINAKITVLMNDLFNLGITDAFCGFKAHRVSKMIPLKLDETGYAFPLQFWPRVARAGLRVTEIPVRLIYNDPNRYFGGNLDVADNRIKHYLEVLDRELRRDKQVPATKLSDCMCCSDS